ncbi:MAG: hypothetical protein WCI73_06730 [Phycisphaerae bacterium]
MIRWFSENAWWLTSASVVCFLLGVGIGLIIMIKLPADYFSETRRRAVAVKRRHPVLRITLLVVKNLAGGLLLVLGIVMALPMVPGPGVLFILLGLSLLDLPGKRAAERYLISRPLVLHSVNVMRARWNRPALITS